MSIYYWSKNHLQRKALNTGNKLPDYNLDPPEDEIFKDIAGPDEPYNWEETSQMLGLHS